MRRVKRWRGVSADLVRPGSLLPSREGIKELFKIPDPYLRSLLFPSLYSPNNGLTKNEEEVSFAERITVQRRTCFVALSSVQRRLASAKRLLSENGEPLNGEPVPVALNSFQHLEFSRFF
ncbi:hypothetical protein LH53_09905 [Mesotoga sp. TolDC]|uniref:hypothetical protein n=1 Tax=Mesotoga sp. UBA6090 TaxID=1946860 RepID=UPI000DA68853|nr:hypothetical protein [Mesotoga sp. UBA6090]PZC51606.1 hypothetical protein LH53_09905 [Mesotoga sp. TolDC]